VALVLALASVAMADPPTRTFVPNVPVSGPVCPGFDVLLTPLVADEYGITFSDGSMIITGRLTIQLTNLSTGNSFVVNASGPAKISADGSTETLFGNSLVLDSGGLKLVSGVTVINETGVVSETGHVTDLCAALA
jgi:hypothetical protein